MMKTKPVFRVRAKGMVALLLPLLTACQSSSTRIKSEWAAPALAEHPIRHLMVIGLSPNAEHRRVLEDAFVRQLTAVGVTAQASYPDARFALAAIDRDKNAARSAMRKLGADGVLVVRLVSERSIRRTPPPTREAMTPNQFDPAVPVRSWSTFYHSSYLEAGRTYADGLDRGVVLESVLYDLADGKPRWSAQTTTLIQEGSNLEAKIGVFVKTLIARFQAAGALAPRPAKE